MSKVPATDKSHKSPQIQFHPLANRFPLMKGKPFDDLVADIKANGQNDPIVLHEGMVLDGRNRVLACLAAGVDVRGVEFDALVKAHGLSNDPLAFVISANIHRRHLSIEDKDRLIVQLLKADHTKSDRAIAETVKASPTHVGKVRRATVHRGQLPEKRVGKDGKARKQPATKPKATPNGEDDVERALNLWTRAVKRFKKAAAAAEKTGDERDRQEFVAQFERVKSAERELEQARKQSAKKAKAAKAAEQPRKTPADLTAELQRAVGAVVERDVKLGLLRDDVGPDSAGEAARLRVRNAELENEKRRLESENIGLRSEVEELKAENARLKATISEIAEIEKAPAPGNDDGLDIPECLRRDANGGAA